MPIINENHIQFFTAVCLNWLNLLDPENCKQIIIRALQYRVATKQVTIAGFVIMPNHIHLIWRIAAGVDRSAFQRDFLKITAKKIIDHYERTDPEIIHKITVNRKDRSLQVWKANSMSLDLYTHRFLLQKLNYIHNNPCQPKWELVTDPVNYVYSSAKFYHDRENPFDMLEHFDEI